jgi:hypothetical protein
MGLLASLFFVGVGSFLLGLSASLLFKTSYPPKQIEVENSAYTNGIRVGVSQGIKIAADYLTTTYSDTESVAEEILSLGGNDGAD